MSITKNNINPGTPRRFVSATLPRFPFAAADHHSRLPHPDPELKNVALTTLSLLTIRSHLFERNTVVVRGPYQTAQHVLIRFRRHRILGDLAYDGTIRGRSEGEREM